ncbi:MAG: hypothetical protein KJO80_05025 [Gammaproteobacteria bacterium]|nr:hypothetical protein [Gammaproteobacteria bacterium]
MQRLEKLINHRSRQTGGMTVFTAVLVLIMLTLMIFYAARVGVFEQRISANEVRQKVAFHAAEAAIDQGVEYLTANQELLLSNAVAGFPDGQGGTRDGWIAANKWTECTSDLVDDLDHPCGGVSPMPVGSFFYNDATTGFELVDDIVVPAATDDVTARLTANICKVDLDDPNTCVGLGVDTGSGTYLLLTLLGYGFSDCTDTTDVSTCQGRATVAKPLGKYQILGGTPTVPLVTRSTFPPNGTALVVPNPNGGGVGVPISAWVNDNTNYTDNSLPSGPRTCDSDAAAILSSGTWNTCELQEWYGREAVPAGTACDQPPGQCSCTNEESISYKETGQNTILGIDIVIDGAFPCDLFHTFFKVEDTAYASVKSSFSAVLDDCSTLDATSSGLIWISGDTCSLNNATVGSPDNPVVIVSAASLTRVTGTVTIFGLVYIFDGEDGAAEFSGAGTGEIYGALIVDAAMDSFTGTVNVVYARDVLVKAADQGGFGAINGGWRDFGMPELAW